MLKTATPVSPYQLSRILRESPRTSKKTSPRRGRGAASFDDMVPMVTRNEPTCPVNDHHAVTCPTAEGPANSPSRLRDGVLEWHHCQADRTWRDARMGMRVPPRSMQGTPRLCHAL